MGSWIIISIGFLAVAAGAVVFVMRRSAATERVPVEGDVTPMSDRRAVMFGVALMVTALLTFTYGYTAMWFLPVIFYLTIWMPQVARRAATPRQGVFVSAMFATAMVSSAVIQIFVLD